MPIELASLGFTEEDLALLNEALRRLRADREEALARTPGREGLRLELHRIDELLRRLEIPLYDERLLQFTG
jgi:hypothetical protein